MKKSSAVLTLVLLGSTGILTGCGEDIPTSTFRTVAECVASGNYNMQQCESSFADARKDFEKNAPAYKSKAECEEEFASCETTATNHPSGGGNFAPMWMGYMMGSMGKSNQVYPQAIYQSKDRSLVSSRGSYFGKNFGSVKVNSMSSDALGVSRTAAPARTTTVSRGFFGARGGFSS